MKNTLQKTTNYSIFESNKYQRPMTRQHINELARSMEARGFFASSPLAVRKNGEGKLVVIDGHNRLEAAKALGIPVYYVVDNVLDDDDIGTVNALQKKWLTQDFIRKYSDAGNKHYQTLVEYMRMGFSHVQASYMLAGLNAPSGHGAFTYMIKSGNFKVKTTSRIDKIWGLIKSVEPVAQDIKRRHYIDAIAALLTVKSFDLNTLQKKILTNPTMLQKVATRDQALEVLEDIYNYRNQNRMALKFLAEQALVESQKNSARNARIANKAKYTTES